jgi:hypothetical protein
MKLWLDDKRPMPWPYTVHVKTASEAIAELEAGGVTHISLDHDLGDIQKTGNGYMVACWIEKAAYEGVLERLEWAVHSMNPIGAENMRRALQNADRFWAQYENPLPDDCPDQKRRTHDQDEEDQG